MSYLLVFLGGGLGAAFRHAVNRAAVLLFGVSFPWGTLIVNVSGSAAIGLLTGWLAGRAGVGSDVRLFVATGFLGGFTTFSAFSLDAAVMWQRGDHLSALGYITASVLLAIGGLFLGLAAARAMT